jgi:hypothetical protein
LILLFFFLLGAGIGDRRRTAVFAGYFFDDRVVEENKGKNARRKEWVRLIFQQEARRAHGQYHNLVRGLSLGDRGYYFR